MVLFSNSGPQRGFFPQFTEANHTCQDNKFTLTLTKQILACEGISLLGQKTVEPGAYFLFCFFHF